MSSRQATESRRWFSLAEHRTVLTVLLAAAFLRGLCLWQFLSSPLAGLYRADHTFYRDWARRIAAGTLSDGHVFEQGPLYAYLVGAYYWLCGPNDALLLALQMGLGLVTVWLVYRIGQLVFDETTACVAAILTAIYGPLMFFECLIMKSFLTPVFCTLLAYCLLMATRSRIERLRTIWMVTAGLIVGGLCLMRENYVLLLPIVVLVAASDKLTWRARILSAVPPILAVAICTAPATLHNLRVAGEPVWVTSGGGEVLYMAWAPDNAGYYRPAPFIRPDPVFEHEDFRLQASKDLGHEVSYRESSRYWARQAIHEAVSDPLRAATLAMKKLWIAFNDFEVPDSEFFEVARKRIGILGVLLTFGWISGWGLLGMFLPGRLQRDRLILISIIAVHLVSIILTYNFARFRLGMVPLWILFAASASVTIGRGLLSTTRRQQMWSVAGLTAGSLLCLTAFFPPPGYAAAGYPQMADGLRHFLDQRVELLRQAKELQAQRAALSLEERQKLAELYYSAQRRDDARRELQEIIDDEPQHSTALMLLAVLEGQRGEYDRAELLLEQALQIDPKDPDLWANLGNARFHRALQGTMAREQRRNELISAQRAYARGVELDPAHSTCRIGLAGVTESLGAD